jgi:peptidoglycan/xylan/chitin deacetylase (PgdA/CDA1 family)
MSMTLKTVLLSTLFRLRYFDVLRHLQAKRIVILMYHRFSEKTEPFKTRQDIFENQIRFLTKKYRFVSLKDYSDILSGKRMSLPGNSIILTIDDGYEDNYTFAYPILKKYSIPATIFLAADFVDRKCWLFSDKLQFILKNAKDPVFEFPLGSTIHHFDVDTFEKWHRTQLTIFNFCKTLNQDDKERFVSELAKHVRVDVPEKTNGEFSPLNWNQIREMKIDGVEFGSHTCSHPILSSLTQKQIEYEVIDSRKEIEKNINSEVYSFCYPNGQPADFDNRVVDVLGKAGYSCAVTTVPGYNQSRSVDPFLLRRIAIGESNKVDMARRLTSL